MLAHAFRILGVFAVVAVFAAPEILLATDRLMVHHSKQPTNAESGLEYEFTFKVMSHSTRDPIDGAAFTIATDMPSMPGAHHMPHVQGEPTGEPGTYKATLDFDMPGQWTLILKFEQPRRDQVVISDTIDHLSGDNAHHEH